MDRNAILDEWLAATLATYPDQTRRVLRELQDPFRNPVGHTIRAGLGAVLDQVLGDLDEAALRRALDGIVRIRAVQDFSAAQAVGFVFVLKAIGRRNRPPHPDFDERVDRVALVAFDLFMECREKIYEAKANEARRRYGVLERAR